MRPEAMPLQMIARTMSVTQETAPMGCPRRSDVIDDDAQYQCDAHAQRKCHGHTGQRYGRLTTKYLRH